MNPQLLDAIDLKDIENIKDTLSTDISRDQNIDLSSSDTVEALLKIDNADVLKLTGQFIAELGKKEDNRKLLTKAEVIRPLVELIGGRREEPEVLYQAFRALGNICFENDQARRLVDKPGLEKVTTTIRHIANENSRNNEKLLTVACGCLLNITMSNDDLQKAVLQMGILDLALVVIRRNLENFDRNEDCFTHVFFILNAVSEHLEDEWFSESLCEAIVDTLRVSNNPEVSTICLELLRMQADNNDIKLFLAKKGTCELIYDLVMKHLHQATDEDSRSVLKMACDLIVLIITGDESMEYLYDNMNGTVYRQMLTWMRSDDVDLLSTGVLAIGNFARKDLHCLQMVDTGLAKELLDILSKYNTTAGDIRLQHALLSALRNLSIPSPNKSKLIEAKLVDVLYPMVKVDQSPVVFKLLGTFRMIVDGQEKVALLLSQRRDFIERIVHWCYNSDHLGVRGEAPRLLSSLIKNCRSSSHSTFLSVTDSVKCLVEMSSSMHPVMQNEALIALNILGATYIKPEDGSTTSGCKKETSCTDIENIGSQSCSGSCRQSLDDLLVKAELGKHMAFVVNKYSEKMEKETVENVLTLLDRVTMKNNLVEHLRSCSLHEALVNLLRNKNVASLHERIVKLSQLIGGT